MSTLRKFIGRAIELVYKSIIKIKAIFKSDSILIYTDSRGWNLGQGRKMGAKDSYIYKLASDYKVDFVICPEKYTTLLDFLDYVEKLNLSKYTCIIVHVGIVDFSIRPKGHLMEFRSKRLFQEQFVQSWPFRYEGVDTFSLSSDSYLEFVATRMNKLNADVLWISSNKIIPNWRGSYWKDRPEQMEAIVSKTEMLFMEFLETRVMNLRSLRYFNTKVHSVDNIHYGSEGMNLLYQEIKKTLE